MLSYKQNSIFKRSRRIFMFFSNNFQPSAFGYRNWVTAPPDSSEKPAHNRQPLQGFAQMLNAHNHCGKQHKQYGAISNV